MRDFVFEFDMLQGWWSDEWKKILTLGIYESRTQEPQFFLSPLAWFKDVFTGCVYRFFLIDMMFISLFSLAPQASLHPLGLLHDSASPSNLLHGSEMLRGCSSYHLESKWQFLSRQR